MEMKELEIIIEKNGRVQVAVRGIPGEGCRTQTKGLEEAIGTVEERNYTAEYYEQPEKVCNFQYQNQQ